MIAVQDVARLVQSAVDVEDEDDDEEDEAPSKPSLSKPGRKGGRHGAVSVSPFILCRTVDHACLLCWVFAVGTIDAFHVHSIMPVYVPFF